MSHLSGLFIEHHSDNQSQYSSSLSHHQSGFPRTRPIQREWSAREPAFCGVRKLQWVPISNKTSKALENNKKILSYYSHVILIICCSRERRSCIAFVQIHFAMNTLVKKSFHNSSPLLSFTQWSLESGASTLTRRASFSAVSQLFLFFSLLSASSVASQTESSPF